MELAYKQFSEMIPYLFIMLLGYFAGKSKLIDTNSLKTVGNVALNFLTPFVVIDLLQTQKTSETTSNLYWAFFSAIIIFFIFYLVAFLFFFGKQKYSSDIYGVSLCSSSVAILAYPLIANFSQGNARIYTAAFLFINQLLFSCFMGKFFYKKRSILKKIVSLSFVLSLLGILMYFLNVELLLPMGNTVSYVAKIVPTLSALIIGMYFSSFPLSGFKLQLDALIVSAFKLLLFPLLVLAICYLVKIPLETTLSLVTLSGLPCGIELECTTFMYQNKNTSYASSITAITFVFACFSIPVITYITLMLF